MEKIVPLTGEKLIKKYEYLYGDTGSYLEKMLLKDALLNLDKYRGKSGVFYFECMNTNVGLVMSAEDIARGIMDNLNLLMVGSHKDSEFTEWCRDKNFECLVVEILHYCPVEDLTFYKNYYNLLKSPYVLGARGTVHSIYKLIEDKDDIAGTIIDFKGGLANSKLSACIREWVTFRDFYKGVPKMLEKTYKTAKTGQVVKTSDFYHTEKECEKVLKVFKKHKDVLIFDKDKFEQATEEYTKEIRDFCLENGFILEDIKEISVLKKRGYIVRF